jgi:hypothetical protein
VPLVAAAVCPHPPVLVPQLAAGAAHELDDLRAACDSAVGRLLASRPEIVAILGSGPDTRAYHSFLASFAGYGLPLAYRLGPGTPGDVPLPLSLAMGVWLLHRAGGSVAPQPVSGAGGPALEAQAVAATAPVDACLALGQRYGRRPERLGLLVMGDGSATRAQHPPGYAHPRVAEFDAMAAKALAEADPEALLALDPVLADEVTAAGRAPWQVLAGAARGTGLTGELLYDGAPYGVHYAVAVWQ